MCVLQVLEDLIEEDDHVADTWHLLALAYYSGRQFSEAAEVLAKGQALIQALGAGPEDELFSAFEELAAVIQEAMQQQEQGQGGGPQQQAEAAQ